MSANKMLLGVLEKISLSKKEHNAIKKRANEITSFFDKNGFEAKIGGSLAKGTLIKKENQDVDIFVLENGKIDKAEKIVVKNFSNVKIIHGSRDYLKIIEENIAFEIIPIAKFKNPKDASNITDFSLMHVQYITKILKKNPKLANEIKLAKAFCSAQNCYGAESYIGGFSGYSLEVLVCHYGGFINFLKKISRDKIIDPVRHFKGKNEILRELNASKLISPIVLIDPTYKYRNVCAGLTQETFDLFLNCAGEFLKKPSDEFFVRKAFSLSDFLENAKKQNLSVYIMDLNTNKQEGDIAGTKMKKFLRFLIRELNRKEQNVVCFDFVYSGGQNAIGYFGIKIKEIINIVGPSVKMKDAVLSFKKVRKKTFVSKGFVCAREKVSVPIIFRNIFSIAEGMSVGFNFKRLI